MKALFVLIALSAVTASAHASQLPGAPVPSPTRIILDSEITRSYLDPQQNLGRVTGGSIQVDRRERQLRLVLQRAFYCPPRALCAMVMPAPYIVELQIVSQSTDRCGSVHYEAQVDRRPMDGDLQRLQVVDNTRNRCPHFVALAPVQATYTTITAGFGFPSVEATSTFDGEQFRTLRAHF